MEEPLKQESEKLARSWMQHDAEFLRDYLVASVEAPRLNLQSIFSRHFLVRSLTGDQFSALMQQECRFAASMNWLVSVARGIGDLAELQVVLYTLRRGARNAEGLEIPRFIAQTFAALPAAAGHLPLPNYIESFLTGTTLLDGQAKAHEPALETFVRLWTEALRPDSQPSTFRPQLISVVEPACGSANDYRFLQAYGIAPFLDYTGFDLCAKNVQNARELFPAIRFEHGNVFELAAADKAFDCCFVHDLFEHLSLEGLGAAIKEICRVTRHGICANFFNMDEIPNHIVRPLNDYHWNTLSMTCVKEWFAAGGFGAQVLHVGTFLRQQFGCDHTHNPNAYTFILRRCSS